MLGSNVRNEASRRHYLHGLLGSSMKRELTVQNQSPSHDLLAALPTLQKAARNRGNQNPSGKLLLVGAEGFEGDAAAACVALRAQMTGCSCHQALMNLLQQDPTLTVSPIMGNTTIAPLSPHLDIGLLEGNSLLNNCSNETIDVHRKGSNT